MAYTFWSVVFGEQPSASKWNILGTNDAGFKDGTNIDASAIITAKLATSAVTTPKLNPTFIDTGITVTVSSAPASATTQVSSAYSYVAGATDEKLLIMFMLSGTATALVGSSIKVYKAGAFIGKQLSADGPTNQTVSHWGMVRTTVAGGSTTSFDLRVSHGGSGTFGVSDVALMIIAMSNV